MTKKQYEKLFNELANGEGVMMLNLVYVSLISSDTVTNLEKCNKSKEELLNMLEAVVSCDIDEHLKEEWKERIKKGLEICEKDRQKLVSESSDEVH